MEFAKSKLDALAKERQALVEELKSIHAEFLECPHAFSNSPSSVSGSDVCSQAESLGESSGMDVGDSPDAPTQHYDMEQAEFQMWRSKRDRKRQRKETTKVAPSAANTFGTLA